MSDEAQEVLTIVREWYGLALGVETLPDHILFRFVALWVAFNALYSLTAPGSKSEKAQLNTFANSKLVREVHATALRDESYRQAIQVLKDDGVYNFQTEKVQHIQNLENVRDILGCVYRVRCNLFHGRKVPANLRDRRLIHASLMIVSELMKRILDKPGALARVV